MELDQFKLKLTDSCTQATLVEHETIQTYIELVEGTEEPLVLAYKAFTDSVSEALGLAN